MHGFVSLICKEGGRKRRDENFEHNYTSNVLLFGFRAIYSCSRHFRGKKVSRTDS